jgi:hypothetical protein
MIVPPLPFWIAALVSLVMISAGVSDVLGHGDQQGYGWWDTGGWKALNNKTLGLGGIISLMEEMDYKGAIKSVSIEELVQISG